MVNLRDAINYPLPQGEVTSNKIYTSSYVNVQENGVCNRGHRYFVASSVGVEPEGKVVVIVVCTACGHTFSKDFQVSSSPTVRLRIEKP